jgi:prepilin-type N-terminal cleavage/methylation domain-containing protein
MKCGQNKNGFTIVELFIVIIVIAILAAITIVAYNKIQERASNSETLEMMDQYKKAFSMYKLEHNDTYPSGMTSCLGGVATLGPSNDKCFDGAGSYPVDPTFDNEIKATIGGVPTGSPKVLVATYSGTTYHFNVSGMYTPYYGMPSLWYGLLGQSTCPSDSVEAPYQGVNGVLCVYVLS